VTVRRHKREPCACDGAVYCLLHYSALTPGGQLQARLAAGIAVKGAYQTSTRTRP
jgi:hypothetical protein